MKKRQTKKAKKCQVSGYSCSGILFEVSHRSHGMCAAMQRTTCDQDEIKWFQMLAYALQVLWFVVSRVWWAQIPFLGGTQFEAAADLLPETNIRCRSSWMWFWAC